MTLIEKYKVIKNFIYEVKYMKLTVRKKLISGFVIVCILLSIIATISIFSIKQINQSYSDLLDRRAVIIANMKDVMNQAMTQNINMRGILLLHDQASEDNLKAANQKTNEIINETKGLINIEANKERLQKIEDTNQLFKQRYEDFLDYARIITIRKIRLLIGKLTLYL